MRRKMVCLIVGLCMLAMTGCSAKQVELEPVTLKPYEKKTFETTVVQQGDITPELHAQLLPVEKISVTYRPPMSDMEVDKVYVTIGDVVKKGDPLVSFKSGDIEKNMKAYQEEYEMQQMLIEHYEQLMLANTDLDYKEDIELLKKDMEITKLYIAEEGAKMDAYTIRAERDGVVDQVSELMTMGKVQTGNDLVSVVYNTGEYKVTIQEEYPFEIGKIYQTTAKDNTYDMELVSIEEMSKGSRTLVFKALDLNSVMRINFMDLRIVKENLKQALYVDEKAVLEVNGKYYVFTLSEDGFKQGIEVEVGNVIDNYVVIKSGVKAGDRVVIN